MRQLRPALRVRVRTPRPPAAMHGRVRIIFVTGWLTQLALRVLALIGAAPARQRELHVVENK